MGCVYIITFQGGKSYIGITSCTLRRRLNLHRNHAKKGREGAVYNAMRKYGEAGMNVRTLLVSDDWDYLRKMERRVISAFGTKYPLGYNLTDGGEGYVRKIYTPEQRAERARADEMRGLDPPVRRGWRHTPEARAKISAAGRGRIFSAERRAKMGASKVGNKYGAGRHVSEEMRRRLSDAQKGRPRFSEEQKREQSLARRGRPWTPARWAAQAARRAK